MNGKEELYKLADEIKEFADENPCDMDFVTMEVIARAARSFLEHLLTPLLSRDQAAQHLGVSTRTLGRLVKQGKIAKPKRRGFQKISFSRSDLDKYKGNVN